MDFKQVVGERYLIILTCKSIYIVDSFSMQELSLYESNLEPSLSLMVPPSFDINEMPMVLL